MRNSITYPQERLRRQRRAGFTLIEIMVALAITMLLLIIILVPINMAINLMHIGRAKSDVQQASLLTLNQMERELRQAIYVYPNNVLPGVTDRAPYNRSALNLNGMPYFQLTNPVTATNTNTALSGTEGACEINDPGKAVPAVNPSRIDFILPRTSNGALVTPLAPAYYLVTYYARRLFMELDYDPIANPIVMFRAQTPYLLNTGLSPYPAPAATPPSPSPPVGSINANTSGSRYPAVAALPAALPAPDCTSQRTQTNRGSAWLTQSGRGEPNLEPLSGATADGSHTLVTPRGMVLVASKGSVSVPDAYIPDTSITCDDISNDGKIDRVKITLVLGQYDAANAAGTSGGQPAAQVARTTLTVALPNVK